MKQGKANYRGLCNILRLCYWKMAFESTWRLLREILWISAKLAALGESLYVNTPYSIRVSLFARALLTGSFLEPEESRKVDVIF